MSFSTLLTRIRTIHRLNLTKFTLVSSYPFTTTPTDLSTNDEGSCVLAAFNQYSIDKPRRLVTQISGSDSVWKYTLTTYVSTWDANFKVERIQYPLPITPPAVQGEFFIDSRWWRETIDPATGNLILLFNRNRPTSTFGMWYICPHLLDPATNTTTIPPQDEEMVAQLAAGECLEVAANIAAGFSDKSTFEGKDLGNQSQRFAERARVCKENYEKLLAKKMPEFAPTWVNWDNDPPGGWERPFHPPDWY